jgi:hypothetical protein
LIPYLLLIAFYGLLFYFIHFPKSSAIEMLNNNPDLAKPMRVLLADDGITIHYSTAHNFMQWAHFVSATESKNLHLLVPDPKRGALILPKRAFPSPTALNEFRAFAQAHIGNTPIGFPVQPAPSADAKQNP